MKKWLKKHKNFNFIAGAIITGVLLLTVLIGIFVTPYDTTQMSVAEKFAKPSLAHWMGCDNYGRDILSRVMEGMGNTFLIAVLTVLIGTVFGVIIGALCGYFGGLLDDILMRINDVLFSFPSILLALVIISLLGTGRLNVTLALGIAFIPSFARIVRSEVTKQCSLD